MTNKITQCQRIIKHMEDFGTITHYEAVKEYGILNFTARMSNIRAMGYKIYTRKIFSQNRYNEKVNWLEYSLKKFKE